MRNIATKVLAHDDMPSRSITAVELLLDLRRDVLLDGVLLQCPRSDVDGLLLHVVGHVDGFDNGFGQRRRALFAGARVARRCGGYGVGLASAIVRFLKGERARFEVGGLDGRVEVGDEEERWGWG